jgi:hypothetical protein
MNESTKETFKRELAAGETTSLPLRDFLVHACEHVRDNMYHPHWSSPVYNFARACRAHPQLAKLHSKDDPEDAAVAALDIVDRVVSSWKPDGGAWQKYFGVASEADARTEFLDAWVKARRALGPTAVQDAAMRAKAQPIILDAKLVKKRGGKEYIDFISLAGWLQVVVGDRNIELPEKLLGEHFGVAPRTIGRYRNWAIDDGFLKFMNPHKRPGPGGKGGRATEFRFDVSRVDMLKNAAHENAAAVFDPEWRPNQEPTFELSADGLASAWVHYSVRLRNRAKEDKVYRVRPVFAEMLKQGVSAAAIMAEIKRASRDRTEYLWQLRKRLTPQGPA